MSRVAGSFRDPSGFVFTRDGQIYRQVNHRYRDDYHILKTSGLYDCLVEQGLLVPHEEVADISGTVDCFLVIRPAPIPFVSYPYEWCFSQLKDAALTMLRIQQIAIQYNMTLKDSSAYNIQFYRGRPVLIDTLSFEIYREGRPWEAYRQFCEHFYVPLLLMAHRDIRLARLLGVYLDGIPLDLGRSLLPFRSMLQVAPLLHIYFHARHQKNFADVKTGVPSGAVSRTGILGIIDSLQSGINALTWNPKGTQWANYYEDTNYSNRAVEEKKRFLSSHLDRVRPKTVWDFGANNGRFSRLASDRNIYTVAFDIDPAAVEQDYLECKQQSSAFLLPLLMDMTNPSSGVGWGNNERLSVFERGPADMALSLALIHHLALTNNVPLSMLAEFHSRLCDDLIIEFIPKHDSQARRLLVSREDIFSDYSQESFELEFLKYFSIIDVKRLSDSERTLYCMKRLR